MEKDYQYFKTRHASMWDQIKQKYWKDKALMQGGIALKKFEFIIMIDGDLQHPIEQIENLIKIHIKIIYLLSEEEQ